MKILELEINKIRGIKNLTLIPNGNTFVVWGPNGTGKSGVIDAIDFLLTGQVTRLIGAGTKDLTLKKHGPHIDEDIKEAYVKALVQLDGVKEPVEIKREMSNPNSMIVDEKFRGNLDSVLEIASRGQHVLTRREILHYVTSEPGTRAEEIQILLNIYEVEKIRQNFVKVSGKATKSAQAFSKALAQAKAGINSTTQDNSYDEKRILLFVNENRGILNGSPIERLDASLLKENIVAPKVIATSDQNITLIEKDIENLKNVFSKEKNERFTEIHNIFLSNLTKVLRNPEILGLLRRQSLLEIGVKTIEEEKINYCPLCEYQWSEGELIKALTKKLESTKEISDLFESIKRVSEEIENEINRLNSTLTRIINVVTNQKELNLELESLKEWRTGSQDFIRLLSNPIENASSIVEKLNGIFTLFAPNQIEKIFSQIFTTLQEKYPKTTPEQTAWDTLTRLEENIKAVELAEKSYSNSKLFEKRAVLLQSKFLEARDNTLNKLYTTIQDKFVELYKQLHGEDEKNFNAKLEPKGAALTFEVDFYGRGSHPPHALHSEGHQDSMGLCLFLALSDFLASGIIDVLLLDDVVMSVDAEHRRSLCNLLISSFPEKQFVITTHDKTWANQLKTEGVVSSKTSIEFYNWDLDSGPHVNFEQDMWQQINKYLEANDVPSAAAKLRRGSESFFETICDNLDASVRYRQNRRWELGDFMPNAVSQYKKLLKEAKKSAQSWNNKELVDELTSVESTVTQVFTRSQIEQWGVNSNVHYNEWSNFSKQDFIPIREAFEDLFNLFICQTCKGNIKLVSRDLKPELLKCNCGNITWNLVENKKK
jgi:recombinational DNA repair ATPase RecF